MPEVNNKQVIIVTGASRGLGREIALAFGRNGYRVVINYLSREQDAAKVANEIKHAGGEAIIFRADVANGREVDSMVDEAIKLWGAIDILVNNAGIAKDGLLLRMSESDWDNVLNTNLKSAFLCIHSASKIMVKRKNGHIINIASISGVQGREGQANYSASKAGLIGLTKASAKELGRFNIKVNAVLPGYIPTDMGEMVSKTILDRVLNENALNRVSDSKEIADFIYHLSSMNNVSGQIFNLDSRIL